MNSGNGKGTANAQDVGRLINEAVADHQAGRYPRAERLYRAVLQMQPGHADARHNLGVVAMQTNRPAEALPHLKAALEARPEIGQYWLTYLAALIQAGQTEAARQVLAQGRQRGLSGPEVDKLVARLGAAAEAAPAAQEINGALALFNAGRMVELEPIARTLTERFAGHGFGWQLLGVVLKALGRNDEALVAMQRAVELRPNDAEVHHNLGLIHQVLGDLDAAVACYLRALAIRPDLADAHACLAAVLHGQGRPLEAEASLRRALEVRPDAGTYRNLGRLLRARGQLADAEASLRAATEYDPEDADGFFDLGTVQQAQGRSSDAELNYRQATALRPDFAEAHSALASIYLGRGMLTEAEDRCRRALAARPDLVEARTNLGCVRRDQGRLDEAIVLFEEVLARDPDFAPAHDGLLFVLNYHPDKRAEEIFAAYHRYDEQFGAPRRSAWQPHGNSRQTDRILKVGYVSPDFHGHAASRFLEPLLARHDKNAFEVFAYAESRRVDQVTERYRGHADHWLDTRGLSDEALAEQIRADGIDILVDLAGHTSGNRLGVFARKPAPVSVSWLGYGYTTGVSAIDYLLTDEASAPAGSEPLFAEAPWRLATPGYVYRPAEGMGEVSPLPALQHGQVTFGTLTRSVRINHRVVRVWSEILKRLPEARLVIDSVHFHDKSQYEAMAGQFAAHGIGRERLDIGFRSPPWDVLRSMDIGLDCFPHNSGTTLFESLYLGIPFVTLAGRPSVGRLGSSILEGVGHPEWIARSEEEYIEQALALASDLPKLAALRAGLRQEMQASPLMDEVGFARRVEDAYRDMFKRWADRVEE